MSRLLDQLDAYFSQKEALDLARQATDIERERDRADELHARARGAIYRRLNRDERRAINSKLWKTQRRTMRDGLATPGPGKFFWRITDYEALPIERLKPYLDPRAIEAAIAVAISMGLRDLGGVQIEQDIGGYDERPEPRRRSPAAARREAANHDRGRAPFHVAYDRRADDLGRLARGQPRAG
jgi:hypothetical protein